MGRRPNYDKPNPMVLIPVLLALVLVCRLDLGVEAASNILEEDIFDIVDPYDNNFEATDAGQTASSSLSEFARIVGGSDANPLSAYPFYSFIAVTRTIDGNTGTIGCGGSLIHEDIVLGAAHCFVGEVSEVQVFVNRTKYSSQTNFEYFRRIESYELHPNYDVDTSANDLVILHLSRAVTQVTPVALNSASGVPPDGADVIVIGLGTLDEDDGGFPTNLQEVMLQITNSETCVQENIDAGAGSITVDPATQVCAAAPGKDSCQGDSGGPMLLSAGNDGGFVQVGVVSFGVGCAQPVSL